MFARSNWRRNALLAWLALLAPVRAVAAEAPPLQPSSVLLPLPASIAPMRGRYVPAERVVIGLPRNAGKELRQLGDVAAAMLRDAWGRPALVTRAKAKAAVRLRLARNSGAASESYSLLITPKGIDLGAGSPAGLFYGLQTLRQLAEHSGAGGIAAARIEDGPRFRWRGLLLDSARHMMPVGYIKRQLDLMARYKFNRLHWHLTDDQGWRLEIRRYPRLTGVGAWRDQSPLGHNLDPYVGDGKRYGGFYTQAEVREIVAYARARHIEVVPEIDIPGHTVAVLASYPELACTPGPFKVYTTWGIADDILCPSQASIDFVKNVLLEVMRLFPSTYIHLGGDEAPTVRWEHSQLVRTLMRRKGLADERAVQGWFLKQIETFVEAHGRQIIGWDEILEGNPRPGATVMSWQGMNGAITAARRGHDVIMTPTDSVYLDYCQGNPAHEPICIGNYLPLSRVYAFEPIPPGLKAREAAHILGGQGNLWTEYLPTPSSVEYMLWPRGLAMAEALWSSKRARSWNSFRARLAPQLATFDRLGVNYRIPEVEDLDHDRLSLEPSASLQLRTLLPGATIRYTLDGTNPGPQSPAYRGPIALPLSAAGTPVTARPFVGSRAGPVTSARYRLARLQPALAASPGTRRGLKRRYFEAAVETLAALGRVPAARSDVAAKIAIPSYARAEQFGLIFEGYLRVPANGIYTFGLQSDDGSDLWIGGEHVINRDGPQSPGESRGEVALARGLHPVILRYFQGGGASALRLMVSYNGEAPREVPTFWWSRTG